MNRLVMNPTHARPQHVESRTGDLRCPYCDRNTKIVFKLGRMFRYFWACINCYKQERRFGQQVINVPFQ